MPAVRTRVAPGSCVAADGRVPLITLLRRAEDAFVAEFDRRIAQSEFGALSLAHSRNVLRHLGGGPLRASQIVSQCQVSKQAVSQQLAHLEAAGYVALRPDPSDARARIVSLTPRGVRAQELARQLFVEIEEDWAGRLGERDAAALRRILDRVDAATRPSDG